MSHKLSAKNKKFYEEVLNSSCDACFGQFRKSQAKKINEGLEILICSKCHCKVHKCCYDLQAKETFINDRIRQFICDKCTDTKAEQKQCFVCHQSDGALILSQQKQYVHVFCALYHNQIDILSYTPKIAVKKSSSYQETSSLCEICNKPNAFQNCAYQNCKRKAHPYCAKRLYAKEELEADQPPKCWNHHLICAENKVLDLSEEIIPYSMLKDTIEQELKEIEEVQTFEIPNKEILLKKVYDEYLKEAQQVKKQSKALKRGGYSFLSCPPHEYSPYCICNGTEESTEMIECETCLTWYHMDCIKYKPSTSQNSNFSCTFCKSLYDLKKKIVEQVMNGKSENFDLKCEFPPKVNFNDVVWIMRAIDSRISKGNVSKMMKELAKYPLRTSKLDKLIKIQHKKNIQILCEEFYHEYFFSDEQFKYFKPHPVLGFDHQNKPIKLEENIRKNKELRKFITALRAFCKKMGIVDEFKAIQNQLDWKDGAISDSYEKIIELSKSQQKYQEVPILKIKAQAYSFLQIVKKVNSGSIITLNQLQQSVQKTSLIQNVPEYLTQPLTQKYQKVKIILNQLKILIQKDPYNLSQIKQQANKLTTDYKIQPPIFYQLYLEERSFTNTLYFYQAKLLGGQIEGELSLKEKFQDLIDKTSAESFVCTEQLVKNLNNFLELRLKANNPKYIFPELALIVSNLQKKTIKYTLTDPNLTVLKREKLQYLFSKVEEYKIQDQYILNLIKKYKEIRQLWNEVCQKSLENLASPNAIRILNDSCENLITLLEKYPLKIQQQSKNQKNMNWLYLARARKQELNQLLTLALQSQLQKNPLTISKLIDTLPKENSLVRSFKQLKKEYYELHNQFLNIIALCSEKMEFFKVDGLKKQRKQQIQINDKKPDLKRFNELLEILNHKKIDFSKQIREITNIINKALDISHNTDKFCKSKLDYEKVTNIEELAQARKQIDELRRKILINCEISLTKQLTDLYHSQIHNRMRSNVLAGNYDLDKNSKLLKFAEEQGIAITATYFKLKEKFDKKNQKSKEINLIKNIENRLRTEAAKETDPLYKNLYIVRKSLNIPDVEQETPKIQEIEELKDKNKEIKTRITRYLSLGTNPQTKVSLEDAKVLLLEALKSPFNLNNLQSFYSQVQKCQSFFSSWKRSLSLGRNTLYNDDKLKQFERLKFRVQELQISSKEIYKLKSAFRVLQTVQNIQQDVLTGTMGQNMDENLSLIEQNLETIEQNQLTGEDSDMVVGAKKKYIKIWINYLKQLRKSNQQPKEQTKEQEQKNSPLVSAKKIRKILYDCYFLLQNEQKSTINILSTEQTMAEIRDQIQFLEHFFIQIKFNYLQGQYNRQTNVMSNWIDIDDIIYEIKAGGALDEIFFIYKPFDDLNKFKYRNLNARNVELLIKKEQAVKRNRPEDLNIQIKEKQDKLTKKISSQVSKHQDDSDSQQKKNPSSVASSSRKKIKEILSKNILKNPELKKAGAWENQVKMIENQIFGQYHDDVVKYFETSEKFQKLFMKLQQCPQISKKLIKKEFQFKFIKLLIENLSTINDIESLMVNKLKQERNAEKFNTTIQASILPTEANKIQEQQNDNVLNMLATGNVNEEYKKDVANELKKIKQGKDKKKKKSKHKNRSHSRSASPEAKFSSQSEQQNIPSYIQKQYAQEGSSKPFDSKFDSDIIPVFPISGQPLMFDPQVNEEQIEDIQKKYPRGSTLKIKTATLQFFLKKKDKLEMKVGLYTQQDFKKITSQLVDPGFTTLNIRKEKSDKQILEYLNKPSRKKYKFLICWLEAETLQQNNNLKQLSIEANERHKIYGWQNDQIKIHVMSIKQFVQLTRFSASIPNRTLSKENVSMFDEERMICVIQYPGEKMYELKEKFKNFTDIERIDETYQVSIPLPSYDTYDPMIATTENPFYPAMPDVQAPSLPSIKPMSFDDTLGKESKPVEFEGWGSGSIDTQVPQGNTSANSFDDIRVRMGFGQFSPIMTDQEDNVPVQANEPMLDLADSLLKSFEHKEAFDIPAMGQGFKPQRNFMQEQPYDRPYEQRQPHYQNKYNQGYNQNKYYNNSGMSQNPMRPYNNNPMGGGYQNRNYNNMNQGGYNPRFQNPNNEFRPYGNNQFNQNRGQGGYQPRHQRNPMFNPMSNNSMMGTNPMNNPIGNNAINQNPMMGNQQNPNNPMIGNNPMSYGQNQYQQNNNPRYPPYPDMGGYQK